MYCIYCNVNYNTVVTYTCTVRVLDTLDVMGDAVQTQSPTASYYRVGYSVLYNIQYTVTVLYCMRDACRKSHTVRYCSEA